MNKIAASIAGQVFGRLTVLGLTRRDRSSDWWLCLCECGAEKEVRRSCLKSGNTRSCGCLSREAAKRHIADIILTNTRHGHARRGATSGEYVAYMSARRRCQRTEGHPDYRDYAGRGIRFNFESFEQFLANLGPRPSRSHSLDRIDNDGNYEPGNVRWATHKEQSVNRRPRRIVDTRASGWTGLTFWI